MIRPALTALALLLPAGLHSQEALQQVEDEGVARIEEGVAAQGRINDISSRSRELLDEYRAQLKLVESLETYIELLDDQLTGQAREISTLETSVTEVASVERQILPLMTRMIDSLDNFVALDVPFLIDERRERVNNLRALMSRSDVTVAEKSRRVFEAYQIETDYGRTIEAYTAKLELDQGSFDAEFLRIGRVNLMYRTVGSGDVGYWDSVERRWQPLGNTPWRRLIDRGLQVARQEVAPELISAALNPSGVEQL
ncbi:MAG: DUF3450 domain-containing protein [Halieaceae bacterium]|jgi:predicted RNase H-like nuclease (RuvC/YqgF family)|nr:DUF3450 domain-containing protein [Halieaceae bacterium]